MKMLANKPITIILSILCLIMIPVIIVLAGKASDVDGELEPVIAELEYTKGLLEKEIGMTAWYGSVQLAERKQSQVTIQGLVNRAAELEQHNNESFTASLQAANSYTTAYNALLTERDYLAGKLAEAIVYAQVVRIVEVEKKVLVDTQDWESLTELEEFLAEDNTDTVLVFKGSVVFNSSCEERAFQLRGGAFDIGKRLETEDLTPPEYKIWYDDTIANNKRHAICKAIIGNEVWYIEPADDRHWLAGYLD